MENASALSAPRVSLCLNEFCLQILEIAGGLNVVDISSSTRLLISGELGYRAYSHHTQNMLIHNNDLESVLWPKKEPVRWSNSSRSSGLTT